LAYDGLGRLSQTSSNSTATTKFAYWGDQLVAEYQDDGTGNYVIKRRHVPGLSGADDPIVTYEGLDLTQPHWLHADQQGTVVAMTDATGTLVGSQPNTYDEYGVPNNAAANTSASTSDLNGGRFQYTGQLWLPEVGLYSYKARMYSPTLGRFMQTDPNGYQSDINWYAYVKNDPINGTDPSGMATVIQPTTCPGYVLNDNTCHGVGPWQPCPDCNGQPPPGYHSIGCDQIGSDVNCYYVINSTAPVQYGSGDNGGNSGGVGGGGGNGNGQPQQAPPCVPAGPKMQCNAQGKQELTPQAAKQACDNYKAVMKSDKAIAKYTTPVGFANTGRGMAQATGARFLAVPSAFTWFLAGITLPPALISYFSSPPPGCTP
jgi:RHS repeat-associated protein